MIEEAKEPTSLIYSSDRDLGVFPNGVNIGTAARYIAEQLGYDQNQVVVAGNSGNDSCLSEQNFRGVIVANAHDDLKRYQHESSVYLSPRPVADGVRDGLKHWIER